MTSQQQSAVRNFVIDFFIAIIIGWLTTYKLSGDVAFVVGILVFIAVQLVRLHLGTSALDKKTETMLSYISAIDQSDLFAELRLLYNFRHVGTLSEHAIQVDPHNILTLWRDTVTRINSTWVAIQYAKPGDTWDLGWGKSSGHFVQEERIKSGCKIERIILFDDPEDRTAWEKVKAIQDSIGVHVLFSDRKELLGNQTVANRIHVLKTLDVAVADSRWVFLIYLDKSRKALGARLTNDDKILEAARFLINEARSVAK
jgi:hypothetical protein